MLNYKLENYNLKNRQPEIHALTKQSMQNTIMNALAKNAQNENQPLQGGMPGNSGFGNVQGAM